jgi:hypothetical protein
VTLEDARAWVKEVFRQRRWWVETLFGNEGAETQEDQYCRACRSSKMNVDCASCGRQIEVVRDDRERKAGHR